MNIIDGWSSQLLLKCFLVFGLNRFHIGFLIVFGFEIQTSVTLHIGHKTGHLWRIWAENQIAIFYCQHLANGVIVVMVFFEKLFSFL